MSLTIHHAVQAISNGSPTDLDSILVCGEAIATPYGTVSVPVRGVRWRLVWRPGEPHAVLNGRRHQYTAWAPWLGAELARRFGHLVEVPE